jgi:membrane protein implicated in regulation of membrane protease activity
MDDKSLGYMIMAASLLMMVGYFIWVFAPWLGASFAWLAPYAEWAYKLPALAAAYLILLIVLWIGYTMATTPPPIPLENPLGSKPRAMRKKREITTPRARHAYRGELS